MTDKQKVIERTFLMVQLGTAQEDSWSTFIRKLWGYFSLQGDVSQIITCVQEVLNTGLFPSSKLGDKPQNWGCPLLGLHFQIA